MLLKMNCSKSGFVVQAIAVTVFSLSLSGVRGHPYSTYYVRRGGGVTENRTKSYRGEGGGLIKSYILKFRRAQNSKLTNFQADHPIFFSFRLFSWKVHLIFTFKFLSEEAANHFEFHFTTE